MNIMLIMPPVENKVSFLRGWHLKAADYGSFPPLGLLYIATVLKKNIPDLQIKVIDCPSEKIDYLELEKIIKEFKPSLVGITAFTLCLVDVLETAKVVKSVSRTTHICLGGPHNTNFPAQTLDYQDIDSIIVGEGEYAFLGLAKHLISGNSVKGIKGLYFKSDRNLQVFESSFIDDLDALPILDINFVNRSVYKSTVGKYKNIITLLTSRGCPYQCTFCDTPLKKFRSRSVDGILNEISARIEQGYQEIFFYDDTFNLSEERVKKLCEAILAKNMKFIWSFRGRVNTCSYEMLTLARRAGCQRIHFGIETGTDAGLLELKKGITTQQIINVLKWCRKLGIKTIADFIIGLPFEKSRDEVSLNIDRLIRFSPDYAQFNVLQPIPGSKIYYDGVKMGIIDSRSWDRYVKSPYPDFEPPIWDVHLNRDDLTKLLQYSYNKFYIRPSCIVRNILSIRTLSELKRILFGGFKILCQK